MVEIHFFQKCHIQQGKYGMRTIACDTNHSDFLSMLILGGYLTGCFLLFMSIVFFMSYLLLVCVEFIQDIRKPKHQDTKDPLLV